MILMRYRLTGIVLACLAVGGSLLALQRGPQSVSDGVYSEPQALRGQTLYKARCTSCHADTLAGRSGPPLAGDDFLGNWAAQPLLDLANKIRRTMPKDETARLTAAEAADVTAYILQFDKFPSGRTELVMDDAALKNLKFPARAVSAAKAGADTQSLALPPTGNLAQVMRGMLFPSANIIFTVQSIDPGAKRPSAKTDDPGGGFDWLSWGMDVYKGWDIVDYAAVSVGESAKLMLTPGRRCENGRPVPVTDPSWIKFTQELADAGAAGYKASQTRNQEIVSDFTNQLNDSCMHCHNVFRGRTHCVKP